MPDTDLKQDAELLFEAVREAGALALSMFRKNVRRWAKPDGSPVTEADVQVDALLRSRLQTGRQAYGWLSEETPDNEERLASDKGWIADPIDGTRAFIRGGSNWCVAVALVSSGRPVAAAIYRPIGEEFFSAVAGGGAYLNGEPIQTTDSLELAGAHVAGTRKSLAGLGRHGILADVSGELPLQLRLAFVAAGRIDAALSFGNKNDWDLAAGDLLVHEAKGLAGDLSGHRYVYNQAQPWQHGLIAGGAERYAAITEALRAS
ncbi:MAG TPA: 3'(2'),5'-bisphosphate nucleotidase CysQ [Aestuariivirga sp.]|nr:3'(2'),5'-bisphosphate nucleotidase CysQ [Aestuariivirga sp.]